jgi:hypothetical protein
MADNRFDPIGLMAASLAAAAMTRPADTTAYASGDLVANSTTAGSVAPIQVLGAARVAGEGGRIAGVKLHKSGTGVANAAFRVHYFRATVAVANGDNAAWVPAVMTNYIGSVDVTVDRVGTAGAVGFAQVADPGLFFDLPDGATTLFALIEARGAYTPASAEVFTLTTDILQN